MSNLKNTILEQIQTTTPRPRWTFQFIEAFRWIFVIVSLVISGFLFGLFWLDLGQVLSLDDAGQNPITKIPSLFLELVVVVIITGIASYFLYRQSNLPGVKNRSLVASLLILSILLSGLGFAAASMIWPELQDTYTSSQEGLERLPFHQVRFSRIYRPGPKLFGGRLIEVREIPNDQLSIKIENPIEKREFVVDKGLLGGFDKIGIQIIVETENPESNKIIKVRPLPSRPRGLRR